MTDLTDLTEALAATERTVGQRQIAAGAARTAIIRRRYAAEIEDVWDACTTPARIARWFLPISGDLRLGGSFQFAGNAEGTILRCEPPRRLTVSWAIEGRPIDEVELRLSSAPDGDTILEIEHASANADTLWGVGIGWELPLAFSLPLELSGELPDMPGVEWFEMTPEIEALVTRHSEIWQTIVAAALGTAPTGPDA